LVVKFVGVRRKEGLLVKEFKDEQKWNLLEMKDDIIYGLASLLPAEYLVLVDFQSGNRTLKSRLHRILLRLCSLSRFRIDFRLQPLALSSNMLFKARHLCELTSTPQVRLFRALSELYFHGSSIDYLCSVYGVQKPVFHELIDWVLENVSVAELRVFSAFFDLHERVDSAHDSAHGGIQNNARTLPAADMVSQRTHASLFPGMCGLNTRCRFALLQNGYTHWQFQRTKNRRLIYKYVHLRQPH
jgi:hypothetical protein